MVPSKNWITSRHEKLRTRKNVQWRSNKQEEVHGLWSEWSERMELEVLEKYKVEEAKKGAYKRMCLAVRMAIRQKREKLAASKMGRRWGISFLMGQRTRFAAKQKYASG